MEINKNTGNNSTENVTQQLSNITLDNTENDQLSSVQQPNNQPPLFDIKKLITTKHFIKMNEDERDWARLDAYERLSAESQKFWQTVIAEKNITDTTKGRLYFSSGYRLCVLVGINPLNVIFDELKFNIDPSCLIDSIAYLSSQQLSDLKTQINQCTEIMKRYWQGIIFVMRRLNTDNTDYAASIYFQWKHLHSSKIQNSSCKKKP